MEQLKVKKKDIIVANAVTYLGLAFLFLYLQYAYRHHLSPFSWLYLRKGAELFWYIALAVMGSAVLVWKHHTFARAAFAISLILVGAKVTEGLFIEFNKVIVVALFFFAVISYFLFQLLSDYLDLASINPNYSSSDLFGPLLKQIPCALQIGDQRHPGSLTNWDNEGCFIKLEGPVDLPGKLTVLVQFQGREFKADGEVVSQTSDLTGVGIKFSESHKDLTIFNWSEFMELIQELGFQPDRLR